MPLRRAPGPNKPNPLLLPPGPKIGDWSGFSNDDDDDEEDHLGVSVLAAADWNRLAAAMAQSGREDREREKGMGWPLLL